MKTIGAYALMGLLVILLLMFTTSNKSEVMEDTIAQKDSEIESRREQVWNLEALATEQNDAIFIKNKVIEAQKRAIYTYTDEIKENGNRALEVKKLKESVEKMEQELAQERSKSSELTTRLEQAKTQVNQPKTEQPEPRITEKPKTEEKPKVEPKIEEKPKTEQPPKKEEAPPVVEEKPKPKEEAPEPPPEEKEEPKEEPKDDPIVEKPVEDPPVEAEPIPRPEDPTVPPEDDEVSGTVIEAEATAYIAMCDTGCSGFTATGYDVRNTIYYEGLRIVAVDPNVIPLYTKVNVKYGSTEFDAIALDTGGAIKGNKVDILVASRDEAIAFGRRQITVTIME